MRYVYLIEETDQQPDGTWQARLVWENGCVYKSVDIHESQWNAVEVQAFIRKKNLALYPQVRRADQVVADVVNRARWANPKLELRGD